MNQRLADASRPHLSAFWGARAEESESVARKTAATLQQLAQVCPIDRWRYADGNVWGAWPTSAKEQADWVESQVFTSQDGEPSPVNGYSFSLNQDIGGLNVTLRFEAGASIDGGRRPANRVGVTFRETSPGDFTPAVVDPIVEAVIDVWEPLAASFRDRVVLELARPTSSWQVSLGYRIWVHDSVGSIQHTAPGVVQSRRATGTLLAAPDDWTTQQVVEAMRETLTMNDIDEVPRART